MSMNGLIIKLKGTFKLRKSQKCPNDNFFGESFSRN